MLRWITRVVVTAAVAGTALVSGQSRDDADMVSRIRAEGLQRSSALSLYRTLTDDIGGRLTGSPAHLRSARWASERFSEWGLANPHLEPFEFGRGWELEHVSVAMTEPRYVPLTAYPDAWSPSTAGPISGRVVYVGDKTAAQILAMSAQLRGAIVLVSRPVTEFVLADRPQPGLTEAPVATGNPALPQARSTTPNGELMKLLKEAGAGVIVRASAYRDGTVGVIGNRATPTDAVPSLMVAGEQYNVMARLAAQGRPVSMRVELRTRSLEQDRNSYNVIAEIPGRDPVLRDQVVIIGGHLDSWHTASGATDNADGAVAAMEAARILRAVGAAPRRTIRVALWSGEEQGLLGARAHVARHFATAEARQRLAVLLNDDPGGGRTLGFYMQGNAAAKTLFDRWLAPLTDLGATRNIIEGIGSTDHVPFDELGMPAFTAIKDFAGYDERTRHTNTDYPDRTTERDLQQSAIVFATIAWQAAMTEAPLPRSKTGG